MNSSMQAAAPTSLGADAPLISVIIPTYNAEAHLDQALASVREQTYPHLQILCVNDGSTDGSLAILRRHGEADGRITIVDKPNGGYGSACNAGLDEAQGEWISIVEPDDYLDPAMYERMLTFATGLHGRTAEGPGAAAAEGPDIIKTPYWRLVDADTPEEAQRPCHYAGQVKPARQPFAITEASILLRYHPSIWSALYRHAFLEDHAIRFPEAPGSAWTDNPFLARTLLQGEIAYLDEPFYYYREGTGEEDAAYLRAHPEVPLERWGEMMDAADELRIQDADVLCQLYRRGLNYLERLAGAGALTGPAFDEAEKAMFARFSPAALDASALLSPAQKERFASLTGNPIPALRAAEHRRAAFQDALCKARSTGLARSAKRMLRR